MDDCIAQFLNFLAVEKNASNNTIAAYRNDLSQFERHAVAGGGGRQRRTWKEVDSDTVVAFVDDLRNRSYKDATVARKVAAVKSFFGFLAAEGLVDQDPTENLRSPQVGKSLPRALTPREVDELLEQPARKNSPRHGVTRRCLNCSTRPGSGLPSWSASIWPTWRSKATR
ncbi:MAG: site-specific integrase [Dehalococcoidia bacterium]|nr:site-specific integrase [Dehalococcoidia bacterium]